MVKSDMRQMNVNEMCGVESTSDINQVIGILEIISYYREDLLYFQLAN